MEKLRERFLREPLPRRLGGLAATLGRISSFARKSTDSGKKHGQKPARIHNRDFCSPCRQRFGQTRLWIFRDCFVANMHHSIALSEAQRRRRAVDQSPALRLRPFGRLRPSAQRGAGNDGNRAFRDYYEGAEGATHWLRRQSLLENQVMKRTVFLLLASILLLAACAPAPTAAPTPEPALSEAEGPTKTPQLSPTQETPVTPTPAVDMEALGITDPQMIAAFKGFEAFVTPESDGRYSVTVEGKKYFLSPDTFDLHADLNNAYAPATVNATDDKNKSVTLIYNKEGLSLNAPLSLDIESPTDFDDSSRLTMLQKYLLQHADPFPERSKGLAYQAEWSENGKAYYLRTDNFGNQSKPSAVWLRYTAPNGNIYYVNPTDINDLDGRKVVMCAYGENAYSNGNEVTLTWLLDNNYNQKIIWPILKADPSFFKKYRAEAARYPEADYSDLAYLLSLPGNKPEELWDFKGDIDAYFTQGTVEGIETIAAKKVDPEIQVMIIPCVIK
jgi:hypothetical protein